MWWPFAKYESLKIRAEHFPKATKDIFPVELIVSWGVLPLGTKSVGFRRRSRLNVGFTKPNPKRIAEIRAFLATEHPHLTMKVYQITEESFRSVLGTVYLLQKPS